MGTHSGGGEGGGGILKESQPFDDYTPRTKEWDHDSFYLRRPFVAFLCSRRQSSLRSCCETRNLVKICRTFVL